jgi:hypothetical protein
MSSSERRIKKKKHTGCCVVADAFALSRPSTRHLSMDCLLDQNIKERSGYKQDKLLNVKLNA